MLHSAMPATAWRILRQCVSHWIFFIATLVLAAALTTQPALAAGSTGDYAGRISAALDGILSRPPFVSPPDFWTALGRFLQGLVLRSPLGAVINAIGRLLHALLGSAAGPVETVLPIVAGLIVAAVLVFAAHRSFGTFLPRAALADEDREQGRRLDAAGARTRAAALAAAGKYREAARYVFLSTLLALDEAGRLRIDVTTGNRDVLRQARAVPHLAAALTPVVRGFELFWFGHAPVTRQDYERYRALNERALEIAR